jgi:hypothetical protein
MSHKQNYTHTVGQKYTRVVGSTSTERDADGPAKTTIDKSGKRDDKYQSSWSAKAQSSVWAWLFSYDISGV